MSSGTVFFAEYCTVPFFGNGEITVPQSASIVLFFWFLWKWGGEKLLVGMKRFRVLVPEMWVLKYGPKNVYLYNINYCLEAGILLHQEIQFKTSRHKQDNLMLIAFKKFLVLSPQNFQFQTHRKGYINVNFNMSSCQSPDAVCIKQTKLIVWQSLK